MDEKRNHNRILFGCWLVTIAALGATAIIAGLCVLLYNLWSNYDPGNYLPYAKFEHVTVYYHSDSKLVYEIILDSATANAHPTVHLKLGDLPAVPLSELTEDYIAEYCQPGLVQKYETMTTYTRGRLSFTYVDGQFERASLYARSDDVLLGPNPDQLEPLQFSLQHAIDTFGPEVTYGKTKVWAP